MAEHQAPDTPSPPLDFEPFDFSNLARSSFVDPSLSNTERAQLRELAVEGGPLWRIMQGLIGWKGMAEAKLAQIDLFAPNGLSIAAGLQAEVKAVIFQYEMWQRMLTFIPPEFEDQGS